MMFTISPLLALRRAHHHPGVDLSRCSHRQALRRRRFIAQWRHTGTLNAQVEEAFTGHALVKVFGRQHDVEAAVPRARTRSCYEASFGAQFISGIIQPAMMFIGNLNYVAIAVDRRPAGVVGRA